jgi:predicted ATP-grasp superfamily ATP-dependent carboligase
MPNSSAMKTSQRPVSVLLLDEDGHHSQKVAVCLGQVKGLKLHVVSNRRWVPIRVSRHVSSFHSYRPGATDAEQLATVLKAIRTTHSQVLLPVLDSGCRFVAAHQALLAQHIALTPIPSAPSLKVGLDKILLWDFLRDHGLPQPAAIALRSVEQAEAELGNLAFPVVFKPALGSGGVGIHKFEDTDTLLSFLGTTWRGAYPALLQSYIHGHDVDCSVFCKEGRILAHTVQVGALSRRNKFGSDEGLEFVCDPQTLAATAQLMSALKWNGIAHVDLRRDRHDNQVKVLDLNPRYWTSLLGSLAAGINFPYLSCLATLGIESAPPRPALRKFFTAEAAVRHLARKCLGRSDSTITVRESGLAYALSDPGPRAFTLAKRCATRVQKISDAFFNHKAMKPGLNEPEPNFSKRAFGRTQPPDAKTSEKKLPISA